MTEGLTQIIFIRRELDWMEVMEWPLTPNALRIDFQLA